MLVDRDEGELARTRPPPRPKALGDVGDHEDDHGGAEGDREREGGHDPGLGQAQEGDGRSQLLGGGGRAGAARELGEGRAVPGEERARVALLEVAERSRRGDEAGVVGGEGRVPGEDLDVVGLEELGPQAVQVIGALEVRVSGSRALDLIDDLAGALEDASMGFDQVRIDVEDALEVEDGLVEGPDLGRGVLRRGGVGESPDPDEQGERHPGPELAGRAVPGLVRVDHRGRST